METIDTIAELKRRLRPVQAQGLRVALVPTMGALHDGHLSLIEIARGRAEVVVASLFVNPMQFGPSEDLEAYPRTLEADQTKLTAAGCDVLFAPPVPEMLPDGAQTFVEVTEMTKHLCGAHRPGHFRGVTTIVMKLLSIVRPDVAVFGEKDFQQLVVLRRMVRDLALDVEIVGAPLVREPDGLAMSSRNAYLSAADRTRSLALSQALSAAEAVYRTGERSAQAILAAAHQVLDDADVEVEYLELTSYEGLESVDSADQPAVVLIAAQIGSTRLIDNRILSRP